MVRRDLQNKELVGDTWSPTDYIRYLKHFLVYVVKHKSRVHQLDFIGALLKANIKNRIFMKLDSIYTDYLPEYSNYFGRALILLKSIYGMTNSGKCFADNLTEWLFEAGFIQSKCQMSI